MKMLGKSATDCAAAFFKLFSTVRPKILMQCGIVPVYYDMKQGLGEKLCPNLGMTQRNHLLKSLL